MYPSTGWHHCWAANPLVLWFILGLYIYVITSYPIQLWFPTWYQRARFSLFSTPSRQPPGRLFHPSGRGGGPFLACSDPSADAPTSSSSLTLALPLHLPSAGMELGQAPYSSLGTTGPPLPVCMASRAADLCFRRWRIRPDPRRRCGRAAWNSAAAAAVGHQQESPHRRRHMPDLAPPPPAQAQHPPPCGVFPSPTPSPAPYASPLVLHDPSLHEPPRANVDRPTPRRGSLHLRRHKCCQPHSSGVAIVLLAPTLLPTRVAASPSASAASTAPPPAIS